MLILRSISEIEKDPNTILTVGSFDGLHAGHREIIRRVRQKAEKRKARSVAVTFHPHPRLFLQPASDIKILSTDEEKAAFLAAEGLDILIFQPFNEAFSQLTSREFISDYLIGKIGLHEMIVGHDHRFGKGRDGDESTLRALSREFSFACSWQPAVEINGVVVSSTRIRNLLREGNVADASRLLGRPYSLSGTVVEGNRRGRTIGFPTANIEVADEHKLIPHPGVYAVRATVEGEKLNGVMNIGFRPTFDEGEKIFNEVNLFGFDRMIYGEDITVEFIDRIRDESRFDSSAELISQINKDVSQAKKILNDFN